VSPQIRIALFVEGSTSPPTRDGRQSLEVLWNDRICQRLGLRRFDRVVPIYKTHLVAMDPRNPPMSGAGEPLDQLMVRELRRSFFDAAVVAWDLVPSWHPDEEYCRWLETLNLYRFLSLSDCLPQNWRDQARARFEELSSRPAPSSRSRPPRLQPGMILPLCMDPVFESLLVQDEGGIKRALGIDREPRGWPRRGWRDPQERRPDLNVLAPAIRSAMGIRPKLGVMRAIRGDMRTHKTQWGEFLLKSLLDDEQSRDRVLEHPILRRLAEVLRGVG
jgi:hypothetical protein